MRAKDFSRARVTPPENVCLLSFIPSFVSWIKHLPSITAFTYFSAQGTSEFSRKGIKYWGDIGFSVFIDISQPTG